MKKIAIKISVILLIICLPKMSMAWGKKGHSIIAEIAFYYLDAASKKNVLKYLNGMTIEDAANWMDEQRSNKEFDYLKPMHYINIEQGETYNRNSTNNIAAELNRIFDELKVMNKLTDKTIQRDLYEIFHLIGDLHQPLHVGYGKDKGGNSYQVQFNGKGSNLHKVWDTDIIEYKGIKLADCLAINIVNKREINVTNWVNEGRLLVDGIYPNNHQIDESYISKNVPVIEKQLALAGVRLATVLEYYFKAIKQEPKFSKVVEDISTISVEDAAKYEGKVVKICTKIFSTKQLFSGGKPTFLNAGRAYPNSPLTILIWGDKLNNFRNSPEKYYEGKNICVTGKIVIYKEKPEIIVSKEEEIEIINP